METLINLFILIPLAAFVVSLLIPAKNENLLSQASFMTVGLQLVCALVYTIYWMSNGHPMLEQRDLVIVRTDSYEFLVVLNFDKVSATYLLVGAFLTFLVTVYSRYYLHREIGYKRFFNTILFFYLGYNITVLSGNLETLFIGWEILGISSFLLIAFYRDRYLPVKNAVKVFSIYRVGDVGLILAMWLLHHMFQSGVTFVQLTNYEAVHEHLQSHTITGVVLAIMILIAAAAKSAQLPFSSWLPRAMEGPTPSSAIFYGSLAVHLGVFLLMRTFPLWEQQVSVRIAIGAVGLATTFIATGITRVQSSIKSQIAYASIAQIGLIFVELAAGFENVALIHFAGNAFLRTYQLLVSPSVVTYLIREQFYDFSPKARSLEAAWPKKLQYSLYILCLKEWNLDSYMYRFLWNPLKWAGNKLTFLTSKTSIIIFFAIYIGGMAVLSMEQAVAKQLLSLLPILFSLIGLVFVLKAFTERKHAKMSWVFVLINHFWIALAVFFNEHFNFRETALYLSGIVTAGILGYICLTRLMRLESIDLDRFHGHVLLHPKLGLLFLVACLAVTGFPITPTFIGEDLIFSHIREEQVLLACIVALSFILDGLAIIRIYARVFLGPHVRSVYEMAYRSS